MYLPPMSRAILSQCILLTKKKQQKKEDEQLRIFIVMTKDNDFDGIESLSGEM